MANMFFAGIPLEGSGARPLEADLYTAAQQGVDHENMSATGNLNVGVVIAYDEHAAHTMSGDILHGDAPVRHGSFTPGEVPAYLPASGAAGRNYSYMNNEAGQYASGASYRVACWLYYTVKLKNRQQDSCAKTRQLADFICHYLFA